ncbi:class I SAM-dependent methyltransferase [Thiorhodospira sibirica]|uniref:class I SAM-dependent methyltransferase n=1 Tax=Thiorhodospira sibirica TaxID=154347 RepID=UPI00022C0B58|nr:class I SAM-dependent methyltransferase [Thiorhodospira sibirica]
MNEESKKDGSTTQDALFPAGHFYSPVVDTIDIAARQDAIWPSTPPVLPGIDFNARQQLEFLERDIGSIGAVFDYPATRAEVDSDAKFFLENGLFGGLDARALFAMLLKLRPRRMIEVGSGFSSLLSADVNRRFLDDAMDFTCIEPYPRDFLKKPIPGLSRVLQNKVESLPLELFAELDDGDVLFIDSSHVAKTGSDVNYLYFQVLPRLRPGVFIHIHDIFFPHDYPKQWVIEENRSWNEQYVLQAMLMYSYAFHVVFGSAYAHYVFPRKIMDVANGELLGGGSFWMRKAT